MKHLNRPLFAAMTLLLVSASGFSMSLGSSTGAVVFGRPLDLTIQARLDGPLDESSNCFSAEIFQGDARFDSNRIRVDVKAAANPLEALIRIRSTATITEPWAKVILRSNCGTKMSRQYDFLTDFSSDLPASLPNTRLPVLAATTRDGQESAAVLPPLTTQTAPATNKALTAKSTAIKQKLTAAAAANEVNSAIATVTTNTDRTTPVASNTPAVRPGQLKSSNKLAVKATAVAEGRSRLKMETFDLADERQVMLKMSTALLAPIASDTPANAQALAQAAAVWRALNAKPEDVAADAQKLQATAAELQNVKNAALKEQARLQERLRMAEEKKFANPLVYALLALLVLALAGLTWMWWRARKSAQAGYAWLGGTTVAAEALPLSSMEGADPVFVNTVNMTLAQPAYEEDPAPALVAVQEAPVTEAHPEVQLVPETPQEALSAPMIFTKPVPKVEVHVDNNPLWPAEAPSAKHTDSPEMLVLTPTEAFIRPITQPEPELHATTPYPQVALEAKVDLPLPLQKVIAPPETLNIDLDFSKISAPAARVAASAKNKHVDKHSDNHIEFYTDDGHAQANEPKPKSLPPLPKSTHKPHKPATPAALDHKSNLIDFESFATPPVPSRSSRFTG